MRNFNEMLIDLNYTKDIIDEYIENIDNPQFMQIPGLSDDCFQQAHVVIQFAKKCHLITDEEFIEYSRILKRKRPDRDIPIV